MGPSEPFSQSRPIAPRFGPGPDPGKPDPRPRARPPPRPSRRSACEREASPLPFLLLPPPGRPRGLFPPKFSISKSRFSRCRVYDCAQTRTPTEEKKADRNEAREAAARHQAAFGDRAARMSTTAPDLFFSPRAAGETGEGERGLRGVERRSGPRGDAQAITGDRASGDPTVENGRAGTAGRLIMGTSPGSSRCGSRRTARSPHG